MPISKSDALRLTKEELEVVRKCEEIIDEKLLGFNGANTVVIGFKELLLPYSTGTDRIFTKIIDDYTKEGMNWKVEVSSREILGPALEFS